MPGGQFYGYRGAGASLNS